MQHLKNKKNASVKHWNKAAQGSSRVPIPEPPQLGEQRKACTQEKGFLALKITAGFGLRIMFCVALHLRLPLIRKATSITSGC